MMISNKTLLKKIEQGYNENYCNGKYTVEVKLETSDLVVYVLTYTYETHETIKVEIETDYLGRVSFYSPVHQCFYSNFSNHVRSVINVFRMLFDLIDTNKDSMIEYYGLELTTDIEQETAETSEQEKEESEYHPQNIERFPSYPANMLNESVLADYGYYVDEQDLIKKDYSRDKNCKPLDSKAARRLISFCANPFAIGPPYNKPLN